MENSNQISVADANLSSVSRDKFTRRGFLGIGSAALAVAGIAPAMAADSSRSDPGPGDPTLDGQNPDSMWPPGTDSKSLVPTFKYPFSLANKRVYEGGWSREVTVRESDIPGNVQEQFLSGPFAVRIAGPHSTGIGHGAPAH